MSNILLLVHRLPYPPDKGDKVRSYHLLKHLAAQHRVFLGTFIDDPTDEPHIATVRSLCADLYFARLNPRLARLRSLEGLLTDEPLTLRYYRDSGLMTWVEQLCRRNLIDMAVIFSSAMAQYVEGLPRLPYLVDFVDVDSAKWTQYASAHRWPLSWIYRREGRCLLAYERRVATRAARSFFVTDNEAALFRRLAPECAIRVEALGNGVDTDFFAPDPKATSPFSSEETPLVFTGAMDYWPNIDAVTWFAARVLPRLVEKWPRLRFHIVGRAPVAAVRALAGKHVAVTGTVADVRPYLQHATLVVAPLQVARGVQNKILEAMAMARPVVAALPCVEAIDAVPGEELVAATTLEDYLRRIDELLLAPAKADAIGRAARSRVVAAYSWEVHMSGIDRYLKANKPSGADA